MTFPERAPLAQRPTVARGAVRAILAVALLAVAPAGSARAAPSTETRQLISDADQKLSVEARGWLGLSRLAPGCSSGLVPVEFTVVNGGTSEAVITVSCTAAYGTMAMTPRVRIVAPPGSTVRSTVHIGSGTLGRAPGPEYLPSMLLLLNPSPGAGPRRDIVCQVHQTWQSTASTSATSSPATPAVPGPPRPQVLTTEARKRLGEARLASSMGITRSEIDPAMTPEDWRGWSPLREFVLTDDDWTAMPTPARRAMLEWIALGGQAILLADDASDARLDALGLPAAASDGHRRVGSGEIIPLAEGSLPSVAPDAPVADPFTGLIERPAGSFDAWWGAGLGRMAGFAERGLPVAAILVFLSLLAIIAGPINVMLFAGRGRPSRIFWTTPLISLVATALLLVLMFLRDGVGGAGARRTLILLDPDRNSMAVLQEQYSRTGILLGRSFPIREPSIMTPEPEDLGASLLYTGMGQSAGSFVEVDDQRRTGDWFSSRTDQGFTLQAVRPGRGRIELLGPPDAPEVLSSLDTPLKRLFLRDDDGRWWKTGPLDAGERRPLEPADGTEFSSQRSEFFTAASPQLVRAVARLGEAPGYAWAEVATPRKVAIATLDAIRWTSDTAWVVGPVVRTEGR